jgi:hypothetical protein
VAAHKKSRDEFARRHQACPFYFSYHQFLYYFGFSQRGSNSHPFPAESPLVALLPEQTSNISSFISENQEIAELIDLQTYLLLDIE